MTRLCSPTVAAAPPAPARWAGTPACADVDDAELFFPVDESEEHTGRAKQVCAGCDLRARCLDYALAIAAPMGIWGGLSTPEREALIRARGRGLR
jgi:WhiB family redox-sensing transcriptional regulator